MRARARMKWLVSVVALAACLPQPPVYQPPDPGAIQEQQRQAFAKSAGYPTNHSAAELEAMIDQQTHTYRATGRRTSGRLDAPAPLQIEGLKGTCYKVVMRLAADARWDRGAEAGLRFDFTSPTGNGSGGPGVKGPGAVASVGCAEASGPIMLTMAPLIGAEPIGHGDYVLELYSKHLTQKEQQELAADKERQIREQEEFSRAEAQKRHDQAVAGCATCDARYQGCIGAGRPDHTCRQDYSSCTFEQVGADAASACPFPR